jgi:hypothetical protein
MFPWKPEAGRNKSRPVPQLLLSSEENCKMVRKGGTVSAKLCSLNCMFCVQDTNYTHTNKVQKLPARGRKVLDIWSPESKLVKFWWPSVAREGGLNRTCQADCPVISEYTNLKKNFGGGEGKRIILKDSVNCVLHITSEVKLESFVNSALFRFTKDLVLRNTIPWRATGLYRCCFCILRLRSTICIVKQ